MPTPRDANRPHNPPGDRPGLSDATPGKSAETFRQKYYGQRRLHHYRGEFRVHNDGLAHAHVTHESISAQIFRFLDSSCDVHGRPFAPTKERVDAILWALSMKCQWIDVPHVPQDIMP